LAEGAVWPVAVVVDFVLAEHGRGVVLIDDQKAVEELAADGRSAPLQYRELVAQDEDLDLFGGVGPVRSAIQLRSLENAR
jgi:hypothetical protein